MKKKVVAHLKGVRQKPKVKVVGEGRFVQRARRPTKQGKKIKSQLLRVDAGFADWCRKRAETDGSVTNVTRKLHERILEMQETVKI